MNKLIKKIKYNTLYKKINYPLLHIVTQNEYNFFSTGDLLFKQSDIITPENLIQLNKKYNTVIIEALNHFPLKILNLLNDGGVIYFFTDRNEEILHELSKYFKFVKNNILALKLEIIPQNNKNIIEYSSGDSDSVNLITASNTELITINDITLISTSYLNSYLEKNFIIRERFLENTEKTNKIIKDLNKLKNREKILLQKQRVIKTALNNFLTKLSQRESLINKKNSRLIKYENYINILLNNLNRNNEISSLNEIFHLDKIIKNNIDFIEEYIKLNSELQKNKDSAPRNSFQIFINESSDSLEELESLYEENSNLIEQNNLYVSEISHLKFDLDEVNEKNIELVKIVNEFETQLKDIEVQKDNEFSEALESLKKEYEQKILQLLEKNKKLSKEFSDLNNKVEKLGEKNIKNLSLLDEKSVLIQKLKLKLEKLKEELTLKDELINKKNMIIREHENKIAILEDEIKNKDLIFKNLKKELNENNKKINSTYYKELYDDLQKKYKKIKNKNKELFNLTQDYKKEIEQYEIKIQELVGYNERITKDIDIDLEDF